MTLQVACQLVVSEYSASVAKSEVFYAEHPLYTTNQCAISLRRAQQVKDR